MRKRKNTWLILGSLLIISILFTSCNAGTTSTQVVDWRDQGEPEYGGTITIRTDSLTQSYDNYSFFNGQWQFWFEHLWMQDWTLDRETWAFQTMFTPAEYYTGLLAESWEQPDAQTIIVHLREGVTWQNKPPVNGREFTADDVEFHYDRMLGTGSGFTEPSPFYAGMTTNWKKVTALDKYTVEFKFKEPTALALLSAVDQFALNTYEAPEAVQQGLLEDWQDAVGTGAWMLTDSVQGNSMTFSKNPDYWGYDQRYTDNRVPYIDELKLLSIPDVSTALAALRTGKIDILTDVGWQQAATLAESNPDLIQAQVPYSSQAIDLRCDTEPFTDIRVRKALQVSIDRETIAETYYSGIVDGTPCGLVNPALTGYCYPYDEWPEELQEEYGYDVDRAKELLAEAGYPNGFETNIIAPTIRDLQLLQVIQSYFREIGVEMAIETMDWAAFTEVTNAGKFDQMSYQAMGYTQPPNITITMRGSTPGMMPNCTFNNSAAYDAIVTEFYTTDDPAAIKPIMVKADKLTIEQHWSVNTFAIVTYNISQPYIMGYSGEGLFWGSGPIYARLWVDQALKNE
jgi:peptide/nickel transport system substrate-binding protein